MVLSIACAACGTIGLARAGEREQLADEISKSGRITLAQTHVSRQVDRANARQNVLDAAAGQRAHRSHYENAPGGTVALDPRMLAGMLALSKQFTFRVSEIAGGSHSGNSRHYAGIAFDVDQINGNPVNKNHPALKTFMKQCRELGATEVLGPGDPGHATHIHAAWPR
jgi:zinc D-Ala-D-Ala carboxypeptidase